MKIFNKLLLTTGTVASGALPLTTVVACGDDPVAIDYSLLGRAERFFDQTFDSDENWETISAIESDTAWEDVLTTISGYDAFQENVNVPTYNEEEDESEFTVHFNGVHSSDNTVQTIILEVLFIEDLKEVDEDGKAITIHHSFYWTIHAANINTKLANIRNELNGKNKISTMTTDEIEAMIDNITSDLGSEVTMTALEEKLKFKNPLSEKLLPDDKGDDTRVIYYLPSVRLARISGIQKVYTCNFSVYSVYQNKNEDGEWVRDGSPSFEFSMKFSLLASDIAEEI